LRLLKTLKQELWNYSTLTKKGDGIKTEKEINRVREELINAQNERLAN